MRMFQFLFKYPGPVFTKGRLVLLSAWPPWLLPVLMVAAAGGLALLIRWRLRHSEAKLRGLRVGAIWATQSALLALLLLLLWQPAVIVSELGSRLRIRFMLGRSIARRVNIGSRSPCQSRTFIGCPEGPVRCRGMPRTYPKLPQLRSDPLRRSSRPIGAFQTRIYPRPHPD